MVCLGLIVFGVNLLGSHEFLKNFRLRRETGKEVTAHGAEADNLGQGGLAGYHSGERTASKDLAIPGTTQAGYLYARRFQAGRLFWTPLGAVGSLPPARSKLEFMVKFYFRKTRSSNFLSKK